MPLINLLIVEDDKTLSELYQTVLEKENYGVYLAAHGEEAFTVLENQNIDLVITDVMMPIMDGYEFVYALRELDAAIPILMITAKDTYQAKNVGFNAGVDDYMTKPVDIKEMLLRIKALIRRTSKFSNNIQTIGSTTLNYDAMTVTQNEETEMLPLKEFLLLYKLVSNPNKIFT